MAFQGCLSWFPKLLFLLRLLWLSEPVLWWLMIACWSTFPFPSIWIGGNHVTQEFPSKNSTWAWDSSSCLSQHAGNLPQSLYYSSRIRSKTCIWPWASGSSESITSAPISSRSELSTGAPWWFVLLQWAFLPLAFVLVNKATKKSLSLFPFPSWKEPVFSGRSGGVLLSRVSGHWLTQAAWYVPLIWASYSLLCTLICSPALGQLVSCFSAIGMHSSWSFLAPEA